MNIFVGGSSRDTDSEYYNAIAEVIGDFIINHQHNLVFGGCNSGLVGKVYSRLIESKKSNILAILPKAYEEDLKEIKCSSAILCDTIAERKNFFLDSSDVMLFLPGGIGTMDELFSAIESKRCHEHNLPIIIVNANNYYKSFFNMLSNICGEGFADTKDQNLYFVANSLSEAINYLLKVEN